METKLNRNQVLKKLQSYKKYHHKTQKEINNKFDDLASLRDELHRLESKSSKSLKSIKSTKIYLKGVEYTEEELIKMVDYYHKHVKSLNNLPVQDGDLLPADTLYNIMLNADIDTIKNYCTTSKEANKICHDKHFWINKFKIENYIVPKKYNMEEYIKIHDLTLKAKQLLMLFQKERIVSDWINVIIYFDKDNIIDILPEELKIAIDMTDIDPEEIEQLGIFMRLYEDDNPPSIGYVVEDDQGDDILGESIDTDENGIVDMLIKIMYYFPNREITDGDNRPYIVYKMLPYFLRDPIIIKRHAYWKNQS